MAVSLDHIQRGRRMKPPKIVLYGVGGIGKTTFAAGAPKPVFLFTEEGQGLLDVPRFEIRPNDPVLRTWPELMGALDALITMPHDFGTVVIDTIDFAEPLLWAHTCETVNGPNGRRCESIEDFGYGKGYMHAVDIASTQLLQRLDRLRTERNTAIVLLAHNDTRKFSPPDGESYERYQLKLQERLAHKVYDWADCVFFAAYQTYVTKDKEGFNNERRRVVNNSARILHTVEMPAWWAKNRYNLPSEIPFPQQGAWNAFQNALIAAANAPSAPAVVPVPVEAKTA